MCINGTLISFCLFIYFADIPTGTLSGSKGQLHYWFIESTKNPASDPVVLWLNGGPGSSSLIGLLTENGQVVTNDNSLTEKVDGIPQVFLNTYAWSKYANVVYLESPKGVGFSYCEGATKNSDCVNTDESTAQDAYEFLANFFASYPEYKANKFFITGESYAGIYIPMLMDQLDQDSLGAKVNLIGAAIGNGCWGNSVGTCAFSSPEAQQISADFYFGHGMYSQKLREEIEGTCGDFSRLSAACLSSLGKMESQIGQFDVYNIYDECGTDDRRRLSHTASLLKAREMMASSVVQVSTEDSFKVTGAYTQALNDYVCGAETAMDAYLADPTVIDALHVKANTPGMTYKKTATDLRPLYAQLISKYQMLIYSGDTDGCVPYVGTEKWTRGLNFTVTQDWHQWFAQPDHTHSKHKAGYAVTFDKFQFITINGAGHMVPQFQPGFAETMFTKFLANEKF
ncbi:S10 family peptidase [archaeon]|nr:MAG: S10 family peptidase [archaeon]